MANVIDLSTRLKQLFAEGYAIVFATHCLLRMRQRQITMQEVIGFLRNAEALKMAEKQKAKFENEEKYDCWFVPAKQWAFVITLVIKPLKKEIEIITIVKKVIE